MKKSLCIIPARGGSKRIPRKNIKIFNGKPIIAYSIEAALGSKLFDIVMVSTDDKEIAEIASDYGAEVPFMRSSENSNDFASSADVVLEVLKFYEIRGMSFDYACCCYATAPLVTSERLVHGHRLLHETQAGSVFPIVDFDFPIWRSFKLLKEDRIAMNWPEYRDIRSQDLPKAFHDAGQWYWLDLKSFIDCNSFYTKTSVGVALDMMDVQDIDTEIDWKLAEMKFNYKNKKNENI